MPRRGKGIVKSGNAGNSSKASKTASTPAVGGTEEKKPLFPIGYKYPLSILNERCQDNGWEKPDVHTYQGSDGWSFAVTLSRINKKTSEKESVRMESRPAYIRPSSIEARHWGATYALYRFCNHMKLHLVLPPGPRDYWNELVAAHKDAPSHLQWMYAADPFAAKKQIEERKAQTAQSSNATSKPGQQRGGVLSESKDIPEVKMASSVRDLVEEVIKRGLSIYPEAAGNDASKLPENSAQDVTQQLGHLGFSSAQIQSATRFLSEQSIIAVNLLSSSTPLDAAIEYLVLHIPECDLPRRFLPSQNSSNPFVTSLHSGSDDLKRRWIEEKAVKEAGWPENVVRECMADVRLANDCESLLVELGRRLIGEREVEQLNPSLIDAPPYNMEPEELEAYGAVYVSKSELVMPLFCAPIKVHIYVSVGAQAAHPRPGYIPMYLSSQTVPAYVRLHLLSKLLISTKSDTFLDTGEGFCLATMRVLEEEWEKLESHGRPELSSVLHHLLPGRITRPIRNTPEVESSSGLAGGVRRQHSKAPDPRSSAKILEEFLALCQKEEYMSLLSTRRQLPAYGFKDTFIQKLEAHRVVVVVGETGCGKTTQLPQFILDFLILSNKGSDASIIVTQPRRLAAISVAKRVSVERLNDGSVGYAVRGEARITKKTKLLFCTTGVALRRIASGDQLQDVSHVIVDEVHERGIDSDILLLGLKRILEKNSNLRVVLMSATINYDRFSEYFGGAPVLSIPGFSQPIVDLYLEDIEPLLRDQANLNATLKENRTAQIRDEGNSHNSRKSMGHTRNRIDYQLIANVVQYIITSAQKRGGILIFLSGSQEIRQCINTVGKIISNKEVEILPLHANLTSDEQSRAFRQLSKWKIVVATNVAETSITIDDILYVIDTGKVKEMKYDPELRLSKLEEGWISRAAGRQRRGRAGRTQPGTCYKLYTRQEEDKMENFSEPEIHRTPLENVVLYVKTMYEDEDPKTLLCGAIDPPKNAAFDLAWNSLVDSGAVEPLGKTTPLGRYMAGLPADVKLAKMLILGTIFQCLDPTLTIVACLSSKPLFVSPIDKRNEANLARARFLTAGSDLLTDVRAYDECTRQDHSRAIQRFCEENFISPSAVQSITSLRNDLFSYLMDLGFIPPNLKPSSEELNRNSDNVNLVKSVILGGLWPHVARVRVRAGAQKFDQVQAGTVAREIKARDYILYDLTYGRVFLHPGSILFDYASWKCDFVTYFHKYQSDKTYLRDATQVPLYSLLLLGGQVTVNNVMGGLSISSRENTIKLRAWPRIGILVNQLRRLLDAQLEKCFETATVLSDISNSDIVDAFKILITSDGLSEID